MVYLFVLATEEDPHLGAGPVRALREQVGEEDAQSTII